MQLNDLISLAQCIVVIQELVAPWVSPLSVSVLLFLISSVRMIVVLEAESFIWLVLLMSHLNNFS